MAHSTGPVRVLSVAVCTDAELDVEFAYTTWQQSCRNLYTIDQACRRPRGHDDGHAAGYGSARVRWKL